MSHILRRSCALGATSPTSRISSRSARGGVFVFLWKKPTTVSNSSLGRFQQDLDFCGEFQSMEHGVCGFPAHSRSYPPKPRRVRLQRALSNWNGILKTVESRESRRTTSSVRRACFEKPRDAETGGVGKCRTYEREPSGRPLCAPYEAPRVHSLRHRTRDERERLWTRATAFARDFTPVHIRHTPSGPNGRFTGRASRESESERERELPRSPAPFCDLHKSTLWCVRVGETGVWALSRGDLMESVLESHT